MAQWGNSDAASNASIQWVSQVKKTQNTANRTDLYGNTSASYFGNKGVAGFFAVDTTEARVSGGPLAIARVLTPGSGYAANATVTITATNGGTSGVANATATRQSSQKKYLSFADFMALMQPRHSLKLSSILQFEKKIIGYHGEHHCSDETLSLLS